MRKVIFNLIILVCFVNNVNAQNWTLVNSNTSDEIIDISFKDDSLGFFLTNTGEIFYSQDGGNNWSLVHQDTDLISGQIAVTKDSIFWFALDLTGTPIKSKSLISLFNFTKDTVDILPMRPVFWNNEIWDVHRVNQLLGGSASGFSVEEFAVSENYIWATNALKIYSSDDFGSAWQEHQFTTNQLTSYPYQSYYNGTNNMVAITQYPTNIHATTDGNNWFWNYPEIDGIYFYFVDFNNYLAYNFFGMASKVYNTTDGGQTLNSENLIDIPSGIYSKDNNNKTIFIYGNNGMLYKSTNAGGLLSVDDLKQKDDFKIYPNPTSEVINLEFPNSITIENIRLVDIQGKTIKTFQNNFEILNIQGIISGNYFLLIQSKDGNTAKKIIVK